MIHIRYYSRSRLVALDLALFRVFLVKLLKFLLDRDFALEHFSGLAVLEIKAIGSTETISVACLKTHFSDFGSSGTWSLVRSGISNLL